MQETYVREYLPFLPGWTLWVMYPLALIGMAFLIGGLVRRVRRYGGPLLQGGSRRRFPGAGRALADALLQRKVVERRLPAALHLSIFYGMLVLFLGTTLVFIDEDILKHVGLGKLLQGDFYVLTEGLLDAAGLALLAGVMVALARRVGLRPPFLLRRRETYLVLAGLAFLAVSGFLLEAYRIAVQSHPRADSAFVGSALAGLFAAADGQGADVQAYRVLWWTHFAGAMGFLVAVGYTGLSHLVTIPANVALQDPLRPRTRLTTPFNLAELLESEDETEPVSGAASTAELPPDVRLASDACVSCGRCHAECPAVAAGRSLSPRDLIQEIQAAVRGDGPEREAIDLEEAVWACTNCYACEQACPSRIRHVDIVLDFRRGLVDLNRLDSQKLSILQALDRNQNPYKLPSHERAAWLGELDYAEEVMWEEGRSFEWLYWLGCSAAYDERAAQVARATMGLMRAAGLSFATLGPLEGCCGEPAKRLGEEGRFQTIALTNTEIFREAGVQRIVTSCPHCLNVLDHEYGSLGFDLEVVHHTKLLDRLLGEGRLQLRPEGGRWADVVYHEPCNLARAGGQHSLPGPSLIPGVLLPQRSGERVFCCGGGAGNMWYTVDPEKTRISHLRSRELLSTGASRVATSCPFCLSMLTDAMGSQEGDRLAVLDVAELLAEHLNERKDRQPA